MCTFYNPPPPLRVKKLKKINWYHLSGKERRLIEIDWTEIKYEFKFWQTFWKNRDAKTILFTFVLAIFSLSLSSFDVISDSLLANSYLSGTNYTQLVNNMSDDKVQNCTLVKRSICKLTNASDCFDIDDYGVNIGKLFF